MRRRLEAPWLIEDKGKRGARKTAGEERERGSVRRQSAEREGRGGQLDERRRTRRRLENKPRDVEDCCFWFGVL